MTEKDRYTNPEQFASDKLRRHVAETAALAEHVRATGKGGTRAEITGNATGTATASTGKSKAAPEGREMTRLRAEAPELAEKALEIAATGYQLESVAATLNEIRDEARQSARSETVSAANLTVEERAKSPKEFESHLYINGRLVQGGINE